MIFRAKSISLGYHELIAIYLWHPVAVLGGFWVGVRTIGEGSSMNEQAAAHVTLTLVAHEI